MRMKFLALGVAALFVCNAAMGQTKSVDEYKSMSTFCSLEASQLDWRKSTEEANQVKNLNRCKMSCKTAADMMQQGLNHPQLKNNVLVCDQSFSELPASISSKYNGQVTPKAETLFTETELLAFSDECTALAQQYPQMSANNREPNFLKCARFCKSAAQEVAKNSPRQGSKILACEREYTGSKARLNP
ncbi:hypothetical protein [Hirschia baltica]|uniref:Uncharacterized protein n=1 Tax=Hirschia baltica (strain ATCC 49814 / DSM 5838 / IFAM 1418) TaxID=582402 RepID=C6XMH6_HIRBI|nr:hypothetical protein [Hirschia baltica]ACT58119.1 hypothetical protein Hbal_0417 [Hirschia baltica ATCC 49814]